jgi:hypothetical protein
MVSPMQHSKRHKKRLRTRRELGGRASEAVDWASLRLLIYTRTVLNDSRSVRRGAHEQKVEVVPEGNAGKNAEI